MRKILFGFILLISAIGFGQGCSDAGICSIGNGFSSVIDSTKNQIEVGNVFGKRIRRCYLHFAVYFLYKSI